MFNISFKLCSLIAVVMFAPDCGQGKPENKRMELDQWNSVRIVTSGGFAGKGNGTVVITSEGKITIERPVMPIKRATSCEGKLSAEDLKSLNDVISKSHPENWNSAGGLNVPSPDAFGYDLELSVGKGSEAKSLKATWYDNTRSMMPEDLKAVSDAISVAREAVEKKCN